MQSDKAKFISHIQNGYSCEGEHLNLGAAMLNNTVIDTAPINIALRTLNRHGLIAGATGTGKTMTMQMLAEQLSEHGVPSLLMDLKGDLSGLAASGTSNPKIIERQAKIGASWHPHTFPVEFLSLSDEPGVRLRASITEFGSVLFAKILDLNETQSGILAVIFKYCSDNNLPLIDLNDLKSVIHCLTTENKEAFAAEYGLISTMSTGSILRKILALEQQDAERFFGEPAFDVNDLLATDSTGFGKINILRVTDLQDRPALFSTFMLGLLNKVYHLFPEIGDTPKPKLVLFIDEAHLIFNNATGALLEKITSIIKLIRSKGVGIVFCTQDPSDIPASILSQLGLKIQHALRAFTAKDHKAIKMSAENYPTSIYYDTTNLLTSLGIGEALVSALDEKGRPTPLAATFLQAPRSRMGTLTTTELREITQRSFLVQKYAQNKNYRSAKTQLNQQKKPILTSKKSNKENTIMKICRMPLIRQLLNTIVREVARAIFVALGLSGRKRYRK